MSTRKTDSNSDVAIPAELAEALGVRRSITLRRLVHQTSLPPEVLIDLALEILDLASRKLRSVPVGANPTGAAVSVRNASASSVYVTGHMASEIVVVDARFGKVTARAPAYMRPWGLGVSIDGATTLVVGDLGVFVFAFGLSARLAANRLK